VSPVRAALLDLYDTLAWSDWPALRELLEERTELTTRELLDALDETRHARGVGAYGSMEADLRAVLRAAGREPDAALVGELAWLIEGFLSTGVHLWDDSIPVLRALRGRGIGTAIVSNCDHGTRPVIDRLGLAEEADSIVLSFEAGVAKPDPGIYLAALDALGARPKEAVFVDDQARYCDGAAQLGIATFIVLREGAAPGEGVSDPGGHRVIRDLRSLLDLL
jgi:HAD superfamily hydrolase (TIGR01509 family)